MYIEAENKYGKFFIPAAAKQRPCSQKIIRGEVWEQATINVIEQYANDQNIVHCGAFFGDMLPALSTMTSKTVYTFEPNPISFKAASKTIEANNLSNVKIQNVGLGEKKDVLPFDGRPSIGGTSRFRQGGYSKEDIQVRTIALDDVIEEPVSVIHLDVEGFEIFALMGAWGILTESQPVLVLEYTKYTSHPFWKKILDLGYKNVGRCDHNHIWKT